MPANFRTYEGQLRLLTAVIAAHPGLRLDYKAIATHYGSDWTNSGIEHFFRPIKKNSCAIQAMVRRGEDAMKFNHSFRQIKQEANAMRKAGGGGSRSSDPTPSADNNPKTPRTGGGNGRKRANPGTGKLMASKKIKGSHGSGKNDECNARHTDDDSDDEIEAISMTPSKVRSNAKKLRVIDDSGNTSHTPTLGIAHLTNDAAAAAYEDDDDIKIVDSADAGTASYFASQSGPQNPSSGCIGATSWAQRSFLGDVNGNGNGNGNGYLFSSDEVVQRNFDENDFDEA